MAVISGGTYNTHVHVDLIVTEKSWSIDNNTSLLEWQLVGWLGVTDSNYWYSNVYHAIEVKIGDIIVYTRAAETAQAIGIGTTATQDSPVVIASGTIPIQHNADGTKTVACSFYVKYRWDGASWQGSGSVPLTTIARASQVSVSSSSAEFGKSVTINTNRINDDFIHVVAYTFGGINGAIIAEEVGDSTTWRIPLSLMTEIPNAVSGVAMITCYTYYNGALIGISTVPVTLIVPSNIVPTLLVEIEESANIPDGISGYIQGKSKLKITNTAGGQYGASIQRIVTSFESSNYTGVDVTTNAVVGSGSIPVKVTATDSRGRTKTVETSVPVQAYTKPTISGVEAYRCASETDATANKNGAYICVKPAGAITALNNNNKKVCNVYYKKASATYYSSKEISMTSYTLTDESVIIPADTVSSYDIYVILQDSFGKAQYVASRVGTTAAFIRILLNSAGEKIAMAIGKAVELVGWLDIGWPARFREYAQFDKPIDSNVYATGDVAANVSGTNQISLTQFYNQLAVIRGSVDNLAYSAVPTVTLLPANADGNPAGSNLCVLITFYIDSANYGVQIGLPLAGATGIYKRECINGTWVAWRHLS